MEGGQIILNGLTTGDLKEIIRVIMREEVVAALNKKHTEEDDALLLSPAEAIRLFKPAISRQTLSEWTKAKLIPSQKVGRRVFYKKSDVLNAANTRKKYQRV